MHTYPIPPPDACPPLPICGRLGVYVGVFACKCANMCAYALIFFRKYSKFNALALLDNSFTISCLCFSIKSVAFLQQDKVLKRRSTKLLPP